jgi:hypothetical protein
MKFKLSNWKRTPPFILNWLSYDKNLWIRHDVAWNPNTPPETLDRLANDKYSWVRWRVALNHNTLPETLDRLANDENSNVRRGVAKNPNTPQYIKDHHKFNQFLKWHILSTNDPMKELS